MAQKMAGYGRKWKKWLAIRGGAVVAYGAFFLLFMNH